MRSAISQVMLTIPDLGLQIETDNAATGTDQVIARDIGGQSISLIFGNGAGDDNTITGNATFALAAGANEFGGGVASFEVLAVSEQAASVINCYFPNAAQVGFDYCQATTVKS